MTPAKIRADGERDVFVIDEDHSVCRVSGQLLTSEGYEVETFDTAELANRLANTSHT